MSTRDIFKKRKEKNNLINNKDLYLLPMDTNILWTINLNLYFIR